MNGVVLLPITCGLLPASVIVSILMSKYGRFRWSVWTGWVVSITGTGLLCLLNTETTAASYVFIFLLVGLGHGLLLSSLSFTVQAISTTQDVAYAAGLYSFIRSLGLCFGVAIGGTVFQNFLSRYLAEAGLPTAISNDAEAFVQVLRTLQPSEYRDNVREVFARAFNPLFGIMTAFCGVAGLASLAIGKHDMDKDLDSEHVLMQKGKSKVDDCS